MPIIIIYEKTIIPVTKKLGKELIKEASPEHKPRASVYVRVPADSEEQIESFNAQIGRYKRRTRVRTGICRNICRYCI